MGRDAVRFVLPITAVLMLVAASVQAAGSAHPDRVVLQAAEDAYKAGDHAKVVEIAGPALKLEKDRNAKVRFHYLLGKSLYEMTAADVKSCIEAGQFKKGFMRNDQSASMKRAMASFQAVYDLDPASPMAPESLFMTGQILDFGCLNHFAEAVVQYELCSKAYPQNEFGRRALARYQKIQPILNQGSHGPTGP